MTAAIRHRGPDAEGTHVDATLSCALGHTRLSIIDLSNLAAQPMFSPSGAHVISFNGEVYNYRELRIELAALGRSFKSNSDTEVVIAAYQAWGSNSFARLNGMFAFAILDKLRRRLVLVRDRLGIKPLYIAKSTRRVAFASEMKSILALDEFAAEPDFSRLHEYLYFGNTLGSNTMFRGISRLPPGSWAEFDLDSGEELVRNVYWSPDFLGVNGGDGALSFSEAVVRTRDLFEAAVKRQLVSDVPVGVFLSGGVDSTALVALATRHYRGKLQTYSVGFDYVGDAEELPIARQVAKKFDTQHHEFHVSSNNIRHVIEKLAIAHDQPFGDPANLPLYQLCSALGGNAKVVLQGDGGDELFGGYRRYEYLSLGSAVVPAAQFVVKGLDLFGLGDRPRFFGAKRFFTALSQRDPVLRMGLLLSVEGPLNPPTRLLSADLRQIVEQQNAFVRYSEVIQSLPMMDMLQSMLQTDLQILLPDIFLEKVDRATMANSIEVRVPFLDFDLVDFVSKLPSSMKVKAGCRKRLLKAALSGIVPDNVLKGRKVGFGVPISAWLAGPLSKYAMDKIQQFSGSKNFFDSDAVLKAFRQHGAKTHDHGQILWKTFQFAMWLDRYAFEPRST